MPNQNLTIKDELSEFLLYKTPNGEVKVEIFFHNENVWLTQKRMAELFGVNVPAISKHLENIFTGGELKRESTVSILETVQNESGRNVKRQMEYYNLDAIISVGYRVNSVQATQFRIWATNKLKEFMIKGFVVDDDRLKNGRHFGKDYFQELLERVRSIRTSERRIYQKITDIFAECSIDYDPKSQITKDFFANVQNKFHFAITGKTAAEIIYEKVDKTQPKMGLLHFKNSPKGRVLKSDTVVAKNYLQETEIKKLERTISAYFDYIENQIENRNEFTMEGLALSVKRFLEFNDFRVLEGLGRVSRKEAEKKAFSEYEDFNKTQVIESDFDRMIKKARKK